MPAMKEWTLMFYFASDNPLAPSIVPQLKSIKQAGFHHEVNVVAHFDPQPSGTPTHIFDVNYVNKLKAERRSPPVFSQIGFSGFTADDPFVSSLIEDKLWRDEEDRSRQRTIRDRLIESMEDIGYDPRLPPPFTKTVEVKDEDETETEAETETGGSRTPAATARRKREEEKELNPRESLRAFLEFCAREYPARHYILFILGHGVVVANDIFLFDENADAQSLSLRGLRKVLNGFKENLREHAPGAELELVSFHSCSVSSIEVAYELQGTANYMLASQGPAFVGSWPYRQILMRLFKDADFLKESDERGRRDSVRAEIAETFRKIAGYCFHNSKDFLLAGYSFDVTLCDLAAVSEYFTQPMLRLSEALSTGLSDSVARNLIVLAHLKAQSDWQENYTDLHDFCYCLSKRCTEFREMLPEEALVALGETVAILDDIVRGCEVVKALLTADRQGVILKSDFVGPEHQYSHGLSVYFPWTRPVDDRKILADYRKYRFNDETSWFNFLDAYFDKTQRRSRSAELNGDGAGANRRAADADEELSEDMASLVFNSGAGRPGGETSLALTPDKVNPNDRTGAPCACPSIKNYPRDTRNIYARRQSSAQQSPEKVVVPLSRPKALLSEEP